MYESETIRYRDYKNYDVNVVYNELLNIYSIVYNSNSPNQSLNLMKSILKDTIVSRKSKKQLDWVSYKRERNFVKNEIQRTKKTLSPKN